MAGNTSIDDELVAQRVGLLEQLHAQVAEAHAKVEAAYSTSGPDQLRAFDETASFAADYAATLLRLEGNVSVLAQEVALAAQNLQATAAAGRRVDDDVAERLLRLINDASALAEGAQQSYVARGGGMHRAIAI